MPVVRLLACALVFALCAPVVAAQEAEIEEVVPIAFLGDVMSYDMSLGSPRLVYGEAGGNNHVVIENTPDVDWFQLTDTAGNVHQQPVLVVDDVTTTYRVSFPNVRMGDGDQVRLQSSSGQSYTMQTTADAGGNVPTPDVCFSIYCEGRFSLAPGWTSTPTTPGVPAPGTSMSSSDDVPIPGIYATAASSSDDNCYGKIVVQAWTKKPSSVTVRDTTSYSEIFTTYSRTKIEGDSEGDPVIPKDDMWVTGFSAVGKTKLSDDDSNFYLSVGNSFQRSDTYRCERGNAAGVYRFEPSIRGPALGLYRTQGNFVLNGDAGIWDVAGDAGDGEINERAKMAADFVCDALAARFGSPYAPPCGDLLGILKPKRVVRDRGNTIDLTSYNEYSKKSDTFNANFYEQFVHEGRANVKFAAGVTYKGDLQKIASSNQGSSPNWQTMKTYKLVNNIHVLVPITPG